MKHRMINDMSSLGTYLEIHPSTALLVLCLLFLGNYSRSALIRSCHSEAINLNALQLANQARGLIWLAIGFACRVLAIGDEAA
jgi:hypothetical protein